MADSFYPPPAWVRLRQSITTSSNYTPPADVGPVYLRIQGSNGGFGGADRKSTRLNSSHT